MTTRTKKPKPLPKSRAARRVWFDALGTAPFFAKEGIDESLHYNRDQERSTIVRVMSSESLEDWLIDNHFKIGPAEICTLGLYYHRIEFPTDGELLLKMRWQ